MKLPKIDKRTLRGILLLVPLLAVLGWIVWQAGRVHPSSSLLPGNKDEKNIDAGDQAELFAFDPNEATYEDFRALGLSARTAAGIVKYRTRGKVFEIPEDFAACYGITDSIYAALKPYINIGVQYRAVPFEHYSRKGGSAAGAVTLVPFNPNELSGEEFQRLGFSARQAEVIVNYRQMIGGFRTADDLAKCYVVSDEKFAQLEPYIIIEQVAKVVPNTDLNTMDSIELVAIRGIGARSAHDILLYREQLGGFARVEQLADLKIISERNFEIIIQQIWVDTTKIRKIDINFAPPQELGKHPYLTGTTLRKVLQGRQLKGGWKSVEELVQDHTLTEAEAERLSPYLVFKE